jgi:hypothetical protein
MSLVSSLVDYLMLEADVDEFVLSVHRADALLHEAVIYVTT